MQCQPPNRDPSRYGAATEGSWELASCLSCNCLQDRRRPGADPHLQATRWKFQSPLVNRLLIMLVATTARVFSDETFNVEVVAVNDGDTLRVLRK